MHLLILILYCTTISAISLPLRHSLLTGNAVPEITESQKTSQHQVEFQRPLTAPFSPNKKVVSNNKHRVSLTEQNHELCDAGSRQWTGSIQLTEDKEMFFWYFESRNDPQNDPVILWMSGGPGATGEFGLFQDSGPCHVNEDGNSTSTVKYSWTNNVNVIYVDQPVGIGFSTVKDRSEMPTNLRSGARDLYLFLSIFATDAFPELSTHTWHIAGESMGGHYTTAYTKYMLEQDGERIRLGLNPLLPFKIDSIIAVDAYIDSTRQAVGYYEFFCHPTDERKPLMNETACAAMAETVPECERLGASCRESYDKTQCLFAFIQCEETVGKLFWAGVKPGGWNPYDDRKECTEPPLCSPFNGGPTVQFLNRPWVQKRLGFSKPFDFEIIDFELNGRWTLDGDVFIPTTRELTWLLDEAKIRVLFVNGNNDIIINTPGQVRMLDEQPWHQQAAYRAVEMKSWFYQNGQYVKDHGRKGVKKGGQWKSSGQLSFFAIDEAGHMAPYDNAEAVEAVLDHWIKP